MLKSPAVGKRFAAKGPEVRSTLPNIRSENVHKFPGPWDGSAAVFAAGRQKSRRGEFRARV